MNFATIVQELWNYCNVLRDDGMGADVKGDAYECLLEKNAQDTKSDNLPPPDVIAQEIVDDVEAALEQFRLIASDLQTDRSDH